MDSIHYPAQGNRHALKCYKGILKTTIPGEIVNRVMDRLLSHHYLDDARLAEKEISKQLGKLHGLSRIKQDLRQKGLDPLVVEQVLENTDVDWFETCLKVKKFGDSQPQDQNEKMIRYLQYRRHSLPVILDCIS